MEEEVGHVIYFRSERSREILTGLTRRIEAVHSHMTLIIVFFFSFLLVMRLRTCFALCCEEERLVDCTVMCVT